MWYKRLKALREKNGYSQGELGKALGLSREAVSNWERGHREPNVETFIKIAKLFNTSLDQLLDAPKLGKDVDEFMRGLEIFFMSDGIDPTDKDIILKDIMELYIKSKGKPPSSG